MRPVRFWSTFVALIAVTSALVVAPTSSPGAQAASASAFDAGNIISDEKFFDGAAMSAGDVESFLVSQQPGCLSGYTCLHQYSQATPAMAENRYCAAMPGAAMESAASIIARVGAACDISQRVLLVLLQKEQSLVTDRDPTSRQFERATGFACPDTAPCDSSFGGFFYQVYYAARQFQVYATWPENYNHRAGRWNSVLYHPNAACGSSPVYIANQATAGLYNYTPYQPNAAALANLYGTGDSCSAYGNRNFWRMWSDWFGSPVGPSGPPFGNFEGAVARGSVAEVSGWAIDPDVVGPVDVHVYVTNNGTRTGTAAVANLPRADVGNAYPAYGAAHGFAVEVPLPPGQSDICVAVINKGVGHDVWLGCKSVTGEPVTGQSGPPFGAFEGAAARGSVAEVSGWAIDPDVVGPVDVHVYVTNNGSRTGTATLANLPRTDVGNAYPVFGASHGFAVEVPLPAGQSDICVAVINKGVGHDVWLGCKSVTGERVTAAPFGNFEGAAVQGDTATVAGWAIDPDTSGPIEVRATVRSSAGSTVTLAVADQRRDDVARAYPAYGSAHGFAVGVKIPDGQSEICVEAVNHGGGPATALGCRTVTREVATGRTGSPFGNYEEARSTSAGVVVSGWVIDPDTVSATDVHVYADGHGIAIRADRPRTDVGAAYPVFGPNHGFSTTLQLAPGTHEVCVYGINSAGSGSNVLMGCRDVTVPQPTTSAGVAPFGNFEAAIVRGDAAAVIGWAIDPDVRGPIDVHVYVTSATGRVGTAAVANLYRADVERAYPVHGGAHGFEVNVSVPTGASEVCVAAIDQGGGGNVWLGCRTVRR